MSTKLTKEQTLEKLQRSAVSYVRAEAVTRSVESNLNTLVAKLSSAEPHQLYLREIEAVRKAIKEIGDIAKQRDEETREIISIVDMSQTNIDTRRCKICKPSIIVSLTPQGDSGSSVVLCSVCMSEV
jgi:hypothetical protein